MSGAKNSIKPTDAKEWWEPVWTGLVMDSEAKHYRALGCALWLLIYCILNADQEQRFLSRKIGVIAADMGIKPRTIREWLKKLKKRGYIETKSNGRTLLIRLKFWKTFSDRQNIDLQNDQSLPGRVAESCRKEKALQGQDCADLSQKLPEDTKFCHSTDISINKNILNIDIDNKNNFMSNINHDKVFKGFKPKTKEELLALDLAQALDDYKALPLYLSYSKKYPEALLRRVLGQVKEIPIQKIKKSRGALFNYLIQQYEKKSP